MTTRVFVSFLALTLLCSCARFQRKPIDEPIPTDPGPIPETAPPPLGDDGPKKPSNPYMNLTGFFARPPMFVEAGDQLKFQRCQPVTIENTQNHEKYSRIFVRQGGNTFAIKGVNRKLLTHKGSRIPLVDKYFKKKLDINGRGRAVAVASSKLCEGQFAQKMPKKEFLFLSGDPDSVKKQTTSKGPVEELFYKSDGSSAPMTYYFLSGQLYSWKN